MATNDVVITLRIDDAGNIKQVGNKAKKAAKDVDKLGKSAASVDRGMKGVSQQSSNASKNFSKMAQGMSGGLVPAYATLAAQVFAVTALFRFLQQAADFRVLIEGQRAFAAETGVAYNSIARSLQDATDGQLAFRDASQAAAIGSAAGVSPGQLEDLAGAARNVSIALGRDLTDSFNRLIRGTTKAEPELLDELGIVLRLEEATKNYAAQIGKTANTLTIYEKSQAVTNEVLKQAEDKFGAIGDNAELQVNALNQFAKAFDDVLNALYEFIGPVAEGLARFFSKNLTAFIGALGVFAIPIIKMILPAFDEMGERALLTAEKHRNALASQRADLQAYQATFQQTRDKAGFAKQQFQSTARDMGLSTTGRGKANAIAHFEKQTTGEVALQNGKRTGILKNASAKQVRILKAQYEAMQGSTSKFTLFFKRQMTTITSSVGIASAKIKTIWSGTMAFMARAASKAGKIINKAFGLLMFVSILVLLIDTVKSFLGFEDKEDPFEGAVDGAKSLNQELEAMQKRFNQKVMGGTIKGTLGDMFSMAAFQGNMVNSANLRERLLEFQSADADGQSKLFPGLKESLDKLGMINIEFQNIANSIQEPADLTQALADRINDAASSMLNFKAASDQVKTAQGELFKLNNAFLQSSAKLPFGGMIQQTRLISEGSDQAAQALGVELQNLVRKERGVGTGLTDAEKARKLALQGTPNADGTFTGGMIRNAAAEAAKADALRSFLLEQSTGAVAIQTEKTRLDIQKEKIRGSRLTAQFARKELDIQKNLQDIEMSKLKIKIQEKILAEGNKEQAQAAQIAIDQENLNIERIKAKNDALKDTMNHLSNLKVAAVDALETGMGNAIVGVLDGTKSLKEGFLDMAKAVLQAIAQIIAQMLAMKAIRALGLGFADGGVIPMAMGGIKPSRGYRTGGIVTAPTYLVGEGKHNEAVVPLPDGRTIPVTMTGAGVGGSTVVNVNISGDGQATSDMVSNGGQRAQDLGKAVSAAVQEEMLKQQRPGGLLSPIGGPS